MFRKFRALAFASAIAAPWLVGPAAAEYLLAPGDVIEFSAAAADLTQRSRVDSSGEISLPLIGQIRAAGRPISEIRSEVRQRMPMKSLRRKTPQGLEVIVIDPEEITIEIAEYRPVYVSGDVAKPGEQVYRLGLTVRQAVALAGGYGAPGQNGTASPADLRSEAKQLWTEFLRAQVQRWRVQAELNDRQELTVERPLEEIPVDPSVASSILKFEREKLTSNGTEFRRHEASLARQIQQIEQQIALVQEQLEKTRIGAQLALEELDRVQALHAKGITPVQRLAEERRLTLASQSQQLLTTERLGEVKRDREALVLEREKLLAQRQIDLSREAQEADLQLANTRARLQAVTQKLLDGGMTASSKGSAPDLLIVRRGNDGGTEKITAEEDTGILPGDTIEVSLRPANGPLSLD